MADLTVLDTATQTILRADLKDAEGNPVDLGSAQWAWHCDQTDLVTLGVDGGNSEQCTVHYTGHLGTAHIVAAITIVSGFSASFDIQIDASAPTTATITVIG